MDQAAKSETEKRPPMVHPTMRRRKWGGARWPICSRGRRAAPLGRGPPPPRAHEAPVGAGREARFSPFSGGRARRDVEIRLQAAAQNSTARRPPELLKG